MKAMPLPKIEEFYRWQSPRKLLNRCDLVSKEMSKQAFIADGKEFEKTVQEAIVAANFALRCNALITPVSAVRMTQQNTEGMDFEIKSNSIHRFEITTAYDEGRRPREDCRDGSEPDIRLGIGPAKPAWLVPFIRNKTEKKLTAERRQGALLNRHLLVYQNFLQRRGGTDVLRLQSLVLDCESVWRSIWLILGVSSESEEESAIALLYPSSDFNCPVGEMDA